MLEFITAPENIPFAVAIVVMLIIALLEGVGALFGAGLSNLLASLFPGSGVDIDIEGPDVDTPSNFGRVLSWLRIGQVPVLVLIVIFLVGFGVSGLALQKLALLTVGFMLPPIIAVFPALITSIFTVRVLGGCLNTIIPKDETSAVSQQSFIGRVAIITLGESKKGSPAQGKVKDKFDRVHYVMIEPDNEEDTFAQGTEVLLVKQEASTFYGIENKNQLLSEDSS